MKIQRVLVVYRKSLYQIYVKDHKERSIRQALRRGDAVALGLRESHRMHETALREVLRLLRRKKIEAVTRWRAHLRPTHHFDLVISLGGDGTLLDTSHRILDATPLLGINSDPTRSVGALCCGTVAELPDLLDALVQGSLRPRRVSRIRVRVNGEEVLGPTLNEVLFAHVCPAGLTRFDMAILARERSLAAHSGHDGCDFEHCRGSGLWMSTAVGSTAAIHSAGGRILPPGSRRLQYLIREPYFGTAAMTSSTYRGEVEPEQTLVLVSRMRQGHLWADGPHRSMALEYSQQVMIDRHPIDLSLVRAPRKWR
jgi:NAD+ kinase